MYFGSIFLVFCLDVLDVFDISGVLQKTIHDIETGTCSWLTTTCMQRGTDEQKRILIENYGKKGLTIVLVFSDFYLYLTVGFFSSSSSKMYW